MSKTYKATIGLEVHAELHTKSKMFCGCKNDPHAGEPNSYICPVCLAHPGSLPVPNEEAIAMVLMFGEAVGATRATYSEFDRKNYFYPDIPKAYQISQYAFPFLTGGQLSGVALTRVHLEEDTARSQHEHDGVSLVDFNRAGVPLMELVTEPVIHDAETAGAFARELQLLLRTLGISEAEMSKGEMRVEANISISATDELGTKVEVKNLNSFRSVEGAIAFEIARQTEVLNAGGNVDQETRGWDEIKLRTFTQRTKETAKDYRYFPDPDIPKINVPAHEYFSQARLSEIIPELPNNKRINYTNIGLPSSQIELIIGTAAIDTVFSTLYKTYYQTNTELLKLAANYLTSDVLAELGADTAKVIEVDNFAELMAMAVEGKINSRIAKDLLKETLFGTISPLKLAEERGLLQSSDPSILLATVSEILAEQPGVVAEYYAGKEAALQFLIGQGMKKTRGSANPGVLAEVIKAELEKARKS
jgi:aspartyl-tRNA(Asn)/glutamyl-tRNA(Gln) amidotransferase subunit B